MDYAHTPLASRYCGVCGWTFDSDHHAGCKPTVLALNFQRFAELAGLSVFEKRLLQLEVAVEAFPDGIIAAFFQSMKARDEEELVGLFALVYGEPVSAVRHAFGGREQKWAINAALPQSVEMLWPVRFPIGLGRLRPLVDVLKVSYSMPGELTMRLVERGFLP